MHFFTALLMVSNEAAAHFRKMHRTAIIFTSSMLLQFIGDFEKFLYWPLITLTICDAIIKAHKIRNAQQVKRKNDC